MTIRSQVTAVLGPVALLLGSTVVCAQVAAQPPVASPTDSQPGPKLGNSTIRIDGATVVCIHKVPVAAQTDGLIEQLLVDEGHTVKKGDVLLRIDCRVAAAELEVAQKELEAAEKQASQTANVDYARKASEVSDAEYADIRSLYNQGAATFSETRRKQLEAERARLGIEVAQVDHEKEILAADVAREKVNAARVQLGMYEVVAPYDGVIVQRMRDQGEWIRSGEPVLRLVHMNEMKVEARVPVEGISVADLQGAPMKVTITLNPRQVATYTPKVEFVSPEIQSGRVLISTRIPNEQVGRSWLLRDSMRANVEIATPVQ